MKPAEAALLAGIPEDPSPGTRSRTRRRPQARRKLVLKLMLSQGYLTQSSVRKSTRLPDARSEGVHLPSTQGVAAPYFANYVKDQLVEALRRRRNVRGRPQGDDDDRGRAAAVGARRDLLGLAAAARPPRSLRSTRTTGAVLAMVGGENYHQNQFNLATQGERQPGSAFKPFVLATALGKTSRRRATLTSKPVTINTGGRVWEVKNYEGEYLGPIDLTKAIA